MKTIIAFVDQNSYKICHSESEIPEGSVSFSSPEELALGLPVQSIDKITATLLNQTTVIHSASAIVAANRLWYLLTLGEPGLEMSKNWTVRKDNFGNPKYQDLTKIELLELTYVPGKDFMTDHFFKKLPAQAKKIYEILRDDGRGIWTNEEATAVVAAKAEVLKTKQSPAQVFNFYRSDFLIKKILRRLSYEELNARSQFSSIFLDGTKP